ncbi:MAG TPA: hypothetical protein VKZ73_06120 [Microbacterium sp.]|nr:hypothetical protein [Microbacterium sp.]
MTARAEARAARGLGLTMSQWDDLDEQDRAWALALDLSDAEVEAGKCPACGGDPDECQDADNQHAYVVSLGRCYRTVAVQNALKRRKDDPDAAALLVKVTLDPARKKSAMRKVANRG